MRSNPAARLRGLEKYGVRDRAERQEARAKAERHELRGIERHHGMAWARCWCDWSSPTFSKASEHWPDLVRASHMRHAAEAS